MYRTYFASLKLFSLYRRVNPLTNGGWLIDPLLFQRPRILKILYCEKIEILPNPLLGPVLANYIFVFLQKHLICLQFVFEKSFPESWGPKDGCQV